MIGTRIIFFVFDQIRKDLYLLLKGIERIRVEANKPDT